MTAKSLGDQELALLRYVADRGGITVGEVADGFGAPRALARSTVLTMMERLRHKGHLTRRRAGGVYRYSSPESSKDVLRRVVESFVERTLDGSVAPFVTYLVERGRVSDAELADLERLVSTLHSRKRDPR